MSCDVDMSIMVTTTVHNQSNCAFAVLYIALRLMLAAAICFVEVDVATFISTLPPLLLLVPSPSPSSMTTAYLSSLIPCLKFVCLPHFSILYVIAALDVDLSSISNIYVFVSPFRFFCFSRMCVSVVIYLFR